MSDACRLEITLLKEDLPRFEAVLGKTFWSWIAEEDGRIVSLVVNEADRGWFDVRPKLAKAGLTFVGSHDHGHEYGAYGFACMDGRHSEVPVDHDGCPVARIGEDDEVVESDVQEARAYLAIREAAGKRFWPEDAAAAASSKKPKE